VVFDMKDHLFEELLLKERFSRVCKTYDWTKYKDSLLPLPVQMMHCCKLAYMLAVAVMQPYAKKLFWK
jgi:hypothetical protein